eukprot:s16_g8.t1
MTLASEALRDQLSQSETTIEELYSEITNLTRSWQEEQSKVTGLQEEGSEIAEERSVSDGLRGEIEQLQLEAQALQGELAELQLCHAALQEEAEALRAELARRILDQEIARDMNLEEWLREDTALQCLYDDCLARVDLLEKLRDKVKKERSRLGMSDPDEASVLATVGRSDLRGAKKFISDVSSSHSSDQSSDRGYPMDRAATEVPKAPPRGAESSQSLSRMSSSARALGASIKHARVQSGDSLTLHISRTQACGTSRAFAAILGDGRVETWGHCALGGGASYGGDSTGVQDQLKNAQQIQASLRAFAAVLGDGSVVTWGPGHWGGDSRAVQDQLKNVQQTQANECAFAAILRDGSVVTWGEASFGGDSNAVQDHLKNVQQIQSTRFAFAAILRDRSVVTWGDADLGGDSRAVQAQLGNVQHIQATHRAFAAILGDGSAVSWGAAADSSAVQHQLTWGHPGHGGDSSSVQDRLQTVQQIQATLCAFAAILGDGSGVTWGDAGSGGDSSAVKDQLKNVQQIQANECAFAAILGEGSVVTWGEAACGGDSSAVQQQLKKVQSIQASDQAFAAILDDGSVVTWGDSGAVLDQLRHVPKKQRSSRSVAMAFVVAVVWHRTRPDLRGT